MASDHQIDVAIVGGGIAGLWLLNRLRQQGYSALLFEKAFLGGGQTIHSQGIIHSGVKYALQGKKTAASEAIAEMPAIWRNCLDGQGEIDLSQVPRLSEHQYLWTNGDLKTKLTGLFVKHAVKSRIQKLSRTHFPAAFQHKAFKGDVYQLEEPVLDVPELVTALIRPVKESIVCCDWSAVEIDVENDYIRSAYFPEQRIALSASQYVFLAGEGNEALLAQMPFLQVAMQRRPLHMVYVKGNLPLLYAHHLRFGQTPTVTITTHPLREGVAWYLGGELAEHGVVRTKAEQIAAARDVLMRLLPWVTFSDTKWNSFFVDRAEIANQGTRPNSPYFAHQGNVSMGWPTKLAFAPTLANNWMTQVLSTAPTHPMLSTSVLGRFKKPQIAEPLWGH